MILLTGGNGFVGRALRTALQSSNLQVRIALRDIRGVQFAATEHAVELGDLANLSSDVALTIVRGADVVIHAAGHPRAPAHKDARPILTAVNEDATRRLATAAASVGVSRFIYLSSVKAYGETTPLDQPVSPSDTPLPSSLYGASKLRAQNHVLSASSRNVVLCPPVIYGTGAKNNILRLARLAKSGMPFPFATLDNLRSLLHVDNIVSAILAVLADSSQQPGGVFMLRDDKEWSTPELFRFMGHAAGSRARLFPFPALVAQSVASLLGKQEMLQSLVSSLRVDDSSFRTRFGWQPPVAAEAGIAQMISQRGH